MKYGDFDGSAEELICSRLQEIEEKEQVKILYAVESGSRAWGFASPDSDYDVRFIYVRPVKHYLQLQESRDFIEWELNETLDINGWDLAKALRCFHKSNATLFEWANSPIVYRDTPAWGRIWRAAQPYFSCKAALYHYYGTARKNYETCLRGELVKYKKYFYVLRPVLACKWIEQRACPPPVLFEELAEAILDMEMRPAVDNLLEIKQQMTEAGQGQPVSVLHDYLEAQIRHFKATAERMHDDRNSDWMALNRVFMEILGSDTDEPIACNHERLPERDRITPFPKFS